jgi:CBS domain-containing protein
MKCKEVMTRDPVCCVPADPAVKAAQVMKNQDVGPVPVVDSAQSKKLVGMVTDRDLALKVVADGRDPNTCKVGDVMTKNVFTCGPEDDLTQATEAMERHQVRRIPVVDQSGKLVGIIAQADIATRAHDSDKTAEVVEEISKPGAMRAG